MRGWSQGEVERISGDGARVDIAMLQKEGLGVGAGMAVDVQLRWKACSSEEALNFVDYGRGQWFGDVETAGAVELVSQFRRRREYDSAAQMGDFMARCWL